MSSKKSRDLYGFQDFQSQERQISAAIDDLKEIREAVEDLAQIPDSVLLRGLGIYVSSSDESSDSDASAQDDPEVEWLSDSDCENTYDPMQSCES